MHNVKKDKLVIKELGWFKPYAGNPRLFEDHVHQLAAIIKKYGFRVPILAKEDGEIIAGHYRLRAAQVAGLREVSAIIVSGLSEKEIRAFRIADNRIAEVSDWDADALIAELTALMPDDGDLDALSDLTAFDVGELRSFLSPEEIIDGDADDEHQFEPDADPDGPVDLLGGDDSELLKDESPINSFRDDVSFEQIGEMGLPPIRKDRLILTPPTDLHCFNKDATEGVNWKQTTVCFYTADRQFERLWTQTARSVTRFRNLGLKQLITPDFSTFFGWPKALRAYNIYRSRFIGRYCQEAGINVIPNVSGTPEDVDYMWNGLPPGCPLSIEIQAKYTKDEIERHTELLMLVLAFRPKFLLVYAPQNRLEMFPLLRQKRVPIHWITPRLIKRRQEADRG